MCGAAMLPAATFLISAASTVYGMQQANAQANAQIGAAEAARQADMQQLDLQAKQTNDSANLEKMERVRQSQREQSKLIAASSEVSGLGGSFLSQLANARLQTGYDTGIIEYNRKNSQKQIGAYQKSTAATYQSRVNEANSRRVSPLMAGLQIAGAGVDSYNHYKTNTKSGIY